MRFGILGLLLLGTLAGSAEAADAGKPWAILPESEGLTAFAQCSRRAPREKGPLWSPSVAQIEELERGLPAYLRKQGHARHAAELGAYRRQYVGFVRAGRKLIYLNALFAELVESTTRICNELSQKRGSPPCAPEAWRQKAMFVCDGGESFWGLEYDPATKTFDHLDFNGDA